MKLNAFCLAFLFALCAKSVCAQESIVRSLQTHASGEGKVTIHQSPEIAAALDRHRGEGVTQIKTSGYRVQVYAGGNSRQAKLEAERMEARVKSTFPELTVYKLFKSPRWLCRVGDFKTREEADVVMRKLRGTGMFKEVSIQKDDEIIIYL